ncbi:MAG: hypothetical protein EBQ60_04955 [Actinobacteria bacterium]|nr:hypothetical protein [Actinomycetota bacterium]
MGEGDFTRPKQPRRPGTSEALHNFFIANDCPPMQGSWKAMIVFGPEPTCAVLYAFNAGLKAPN